MSADARPAGEAETLSAPPAVCLDCGLPYEQFALDVILPRPQWLEIHPDENGLLCARCIVARAAKMPGSRCIHAIVEYASAPAPVAPDLRALVERWYAEADEAGKYSLRGRAKVECADALLAALEGAHGR